MWLSGCMSSVVTALPQVAVVVGIQSLAQEFPYAMDTAKKKKEVNLSFNSTHIQRNPGTRSQRMETTEKALGGIKGQGRAHRS